MKKWKVLGIGCIMLIGMMACEAEVEPGPLSWAKDYQGGSVTFSVKSSETYLQVNRSSGQDILKVSLPGQLFEPPVAVQKISRDQASWKTPVEAFKSDWSAQLAEELEWMLINFASSDQAEMGQLMGDANVRRKNREALQGFGQPQILGWAAQDQFVVLIVEYANGTRIAFTFVREQGHWKRTNALADDQTFDIVFAAIDHGTFAK